MSRAFTRIGRVWSWSGAFDNDVSIHPGLTLPATLEEAAARLRQQDAEALVRKYPVLTVERALLVVDTARAVGAEPVWLAEVINFESRFQPDAVNPTSGATGLIQFMPSSARRLGTTTAALRTMTFEQQWPYVDRYFRSVAAGEWTGDEGGLLDTRVKIAMAVFYPAYRNLDPGTRFPANVLAANEAIRKAGGTPAAYVNVALSTSGAGRGGMAPRGARPARRSTPAPTAAAGGAAGLVALAAVVGIALFAVVRTR